MYSPLSVYVAHVLMEERHRQAMSPQARARRSVTRLRRRRSWPTR
jgi:hypothetical protein